MLKNITNGTILVITEKGNVSLKSGDTIKASEVLNVERLIGIGFVAKVEDKPADTNEDKPENKTKATVNKPKAPSKSK